MHDPEFYTVNEFAERFRLSISAVYEHTYTGRLPGVVRFGKRTLIRRSAVEEQIDRTGQILLPAVAA